MFWFVSKKQLEKEKKKIRDAFRKRDKKKTAKPKDLEILKDMIKELSSKIVSKEDVELMIKKAIPEVSGVRTPIPQSSRTPMRMKFEKVINKAEIQQTIKDMIEKDYSTTDAFTEIVEVMKLCKKTSFYKHLKIVRDKGIEFHEVHK